ncbi:hypothetical protein ABIE37_000348 [Arthrobacter bambusae]|uniref:Uncharacterized protein n=1 Tax=Arthrobacter bambusae TaxID=1338426 RepID=A0ABV2P1H0_9MICC
MRHPGQSGGCPDESEAGVVDIVHTSFLLDRQPKDGESALQALQMTCWLSALNPNEASGQDQAPTSKARLPRPAEQPKSDHPQPTRTTNIQHSGCTSLIINMA